MTSPVVIGPHGSYCDAIWLPFKLIMDEPTSEENCIISPSLLASIDLDKSLDPAFDIGMAGWISEEYEAKFKRYEAAKQKQPAPKKKKLDLSLNKANKENEPPPKKTKLNLSLKNGRFGTPVSPNSRKKAAEGVVPVNTTLSNSWAVKNLNSWIHFRNTIRPDDLAPEDLLSCGDAQVVCKWLCCFVQETKKENGEPYPATSTVAPIRHPASPSGKQCTIQPF